MTNTKDLFFAMLRNALWHTKEQIPLELTEPASDKLLWAAKEQTVLGLVCDALIRNNVRLPRQKVFEAVRLLAQIRQANEQLNKELKQFVALPMKNYVVVKG